MRMAPLVLFIDDDSLIREACALFCERNGFRVAHAADAPEAIQKAFLFVPEAIVLDLVLPSMPGWELAKRLRADDRTAHIPIVATSGLDGVEAERKAKAAGAVRFLPKPFELPALLDQIRQVLPA